MEEYNNQTKGEYNRLSSIERDYRLIKRFIAGEIAEGKDISNGIIEGYFRLEDNYNKTKKHSIQQSVEATKQAERDRAESEIQQALEPAA